MMGPWLGMACDRLGLGDIEAFIIVTSPEFNSVALCCNGEGTAVHCAWRPEGSLRFMLLPAFSCCTAKCWLF